MLSEFTERQVLMARGRLSLARMYMRDITGHADFGRMVDNRGSAFNCSKARWIEFVQRICEEYQAILPVETRDLIERLTPFVD